ncbi:MAG: M1 family metallopeptidase [Deltaproteobacteria bacterium]|nr:M1 family metallopeptidase [Deltaproteobacteria bacterium]
MRRSWLLSLALLAACAACAACASQSGAPAVTPEAAPDPRLPPGTTPLAYRLRLEIDPQKATFQGRVAIRLRLDDATQSFLVHARALEIKAAHYQTTGSEPVAVELREAAPGRAEVRAPALLPAGEGELVVEYQGRFNDTPDGAFVVHEGGKDYVFTQLEAVQGRRVLPCFDEPRFKTSFDLTLVIPEGQRAVANTLPLESKRLADGRREIHFAPTLPLPSYLLFFAVGPLDELEGPVLPPSEYRPRPLPIRGYAAAGKGPLLKRSLEIAAQVVVSTEWLLRAPYPFDKLDLLAVPQFLGAMENAAAITFDDAAIAIDLEHAAIAQRARAVGLIGHEIAHQWFGNSVTMPWWDDLWLNEAFATWMESQTTAAVAPELNAELLELGWLADSLDADARATARRIREPIVTEDDIVNAFDDITYSKGAVVLGMIEKNLGRDTFLRGVRRYLTENALGVGTAQHLFAALSAEAKRDVGALFASYLDRPGLPQVQVDVTCERGRASAVLTQARALPLGTAPDPVEPWQIPLCLRVARKGLTEELCTVLATTTATLELGTECPAWVLPNARGAGYFRFVLSSHAFAQLIDAREGLSWRERFVLGDAIQAAAEGGRLAVADALALGAKLAAELRPVPDGRELATEAIEEWLPPELAARARGFASETWGPTWKQLLAGDPERTGAAAAQRFGELTAFLGETALDSEASAWLAARGTEWLALDAPRAEIRPDAIPLALVPYAVARAIDGKGAVGFERALLRLDHAGDPAVRRALIRGLGRVRTPALADRVRTTALEARWSGADLYYLILSHVEVPANREPALSWLETHFEAIAGALGEEFLTELSVIPGALCREADKIRVQKGVGPRLTGVPGGPRALASAQEAIEVCVATTKAHAASARAFFEARGR